MKLSSIFLVAGLPATTVLAQNDANNSSYSFGVEESFTTGNSSWFSGEYTQGFHCDAFSGRVVSDCNACLQAGCSMVTDDLGGSRECLQSCELVADTACWDLKYQPELTAAEMCENADQVAADETICAQEGLTDCGSCTSTLLSDGESTCDWYYWVAADEYFCASIAGACRGDTCHQAVRVCEETADNMEEIIVDEDSSVAEEDSSAAGGAGGRCNGFDSCDKCLKSIVGCAWAENTCHPSTAFPNMTSLDLCGVEEAVERSGNIDAVQSSAPGVVVMGLGCLATMFVGLLAVL